MLDEGQRPETVELELEDPVGIIEGRRPGLERHGLEVEHGGSRIAGETRALGNMVGAGGCSQVREQKSITFNDLRIALPAYNAGMWLLAAGPFALVACFSVCCFGMLGLQPFARRILIFITKASANVISVSDREIT